MGDADPALMPVHCFASDGAGLPEIRAVQAGSSVRNESNPSPRQRNDIRYVLLAHPAEALNPTIQGDAMTPIHHK